MRGELVNGLAGARQIQAQLKEGKQRERELRATNSILQAKVASISATAGGGGGTDRQTQQVRVTVREVGQSTDPGHARLCVFNILFARVRGAAPIRIPIFGLSWCLCLCLCSRDTYPKLFLRLQAVRVFVAVFLLFLGIFFEEIEGPPKRSGVSCARSLETLFRYGMYVFLFFVFFF